MELLKKLYLIYSPSGYEYKMNEFIKSQLDDMKIKYKSDGNIIYSFKKNTPLLCCHQDQVSNYPIYRVRQKNDILYSDGNLGADDKNGIWITLNLLKQFSDISFIFSDQEEIGGNLTDFLWYHQDILKSIKYGIIFDRRNGQDIVCHNNLYGTKKFQNQLYKIGISHGYKPATGAWSDCDELSNYVSCANLSCGYYNAHSKTEYTKISEIKNALQYGIAILSKITKKYPPIARYQHIKKASYNQSIFPKHDDYNDFADNKIESKGSIYLYCELCDDYFLENDIFDGKCPYCNTFLRRFQDAG